MNIEKPHDVITEEAFRKLPQTLQTKYRPITAEDARVVSGLPVDQRVHWCFDGFDAQRLRKAQEKRDRKLRR